MSQKKYYLSLIAELKQEYTAILLSIDKIEKDISSYWKYEEEVKIFHPLSDTEYKIIDGDFLYFESFDEGYELNEVIIGPESNIKPVDIQLIIKKINYQHEVTIFKAIPHMNFF